MDALPVRGGPSVRGRERARGPPPPEPALPEARLAPRSRAPLRSHVVSPGSRGGTLGRPRPPRGLPARRDGAVPPGPPRSGRHEGRRAGARRRARPRGAVLREVSRPPDEPGASARPEGLRRLAVQSRRPASVPPGTRSRPLNREGPRPESTRPPLGPFPFVAY